MKVKDILAMLSKQNVQYDVHGNIEKDITGFSSIYQYQMTTITWLRDIKTFEERNFTIPEAFTCIVTKSDTPQIQQAYCQIWVKNPKDVFFDILNYFWGEEEKLFISPLAEIESGATIGEKVSIGPFTFVSSDTIIGDNCRIGANVTIKGKVHIGKNCVIQSGAVIGEDGFAFIKEENAQKFVKHYGGVTIEDYVSIGSHTCICRGAIDDTYIKEYAKIDNLCHIAHNVIIGKRTIIVAGTVIMGSVHVGNDCWIATSIIRDQRQVGDKVVIGMGSIVVKDVPDEITIAGNPAKSFERKERI